MKMNTDSAYASLNYMLSIQNNLTQLMNKLNSSIDIVSTLVQNYKNIDGQECPEKEEHWHEWLNEHRIDDCTRKYYFTVLDYSVDSKIENVKSLIGSALLSLNKLTIIIRGVIASIDKVVEQHSQLVNNFGSALVWTDETSLNFREGEGTDTKKIGSIPKGSSITLLEKLDSNKEWTKVMVNGTVGFVATKFLKPDFNFVGQIYTVKSGDSLSAITDEMNKKLGTNYTYDDIAKYNHITNPNYIEPGQVIRVPLVTNEALLTSYQGDVSEGKDYLGRDVLVTTTVENGVHVERSYYQGKLSEVFSEYDNGNTERFYYDDNQNIKSFDKYDSSSNTRTEKYFDSDNQDKVLSEVVEDYNNNEIKLITYDKNGGVASENIAVREKDHSGRDVLVVTTSDEDSTVYGSGVVKSSYYQGKLIESSTRYDNGNTRKYYYDDNQNVKSAVEFDYDSKIRTDTFFDSTNMERVLKKVSIDYNTNNVTICKYDSEGNMIENSMTLDEYRSEEMSK